MRRNVHFDIATVVFADWTRFVPRVMAKDVKIMVCEFWLRAVRLLEKNIYTHCRYDTKFDRLDQ